VVHPDVLELEDHVQLAPGRVGVEHRLLDRHARHLADGQQPVPAGQHLAVHLLQELVDPRPAQEVRRAVPVRRAGCRRAVRQ
jgi:hypothetical protein